MQHSFTCDDLFPPLSTGRESAGPRCSRPARRLAQSSSLLRVCRKCTQTLPHPQTQSMLRPTRSCLPELSAAPLLFLSAWAPPHLPGPPVTAACRPTASTRPQPVISDPADTVQGPDAALKAPGSGPSSQSRASYTLIPDCRACQSGHVSGSLYPLPILPGGPPPLCLPDTSRCSHGSLSLEATASRKPSASRLRPNTVLIHFPVRSLHWPHAPGVKNRVWVAPLLSLQELVAAPRLAAADQLAGSRWAGDSWATLSVTSQGGRWPLSSWRPCLPSPAPPLPATWAGCPLFS